MLSVKIFCCLVFVHPTDLFWPVIRHQRWIICSVNFCCHENILFPLSFISVIIFINLPVLLFSASFGSVISLVFCCFRLSDLETFAKWPLFLQLRHIDSGAGLLWLGLQFDALQYLQFRFFGLSFGLVPYFLVYGCLCIGCSFIFSPFDISVSGKVFFLFFLSYVLCCICSTTFDTSNPLAFNGLSRNFLSVIDAIIFGKSNLVLNFGKSHCFYSSINFSQWYSGFSEPVSFVQKNLHVSWICSFSVNSVCYIVWLVCRFYFCPVRFDIRTVLFVVLLRVPMSKKNLFVSFLLLLPIQFRSLFPLWLLLRYLYRIFFLYCLNCANHCR